MDGDERLSLPELPLPDDVVVADAENLSPGSPARGNGEGGLAPADKEPSRAAAVIELKLLLRRGEGRLFFLASPEAPVSPSCRVLIGLGAPVDMLPCRDRGAGMPVRGLMTSARPEMEGLRDGSRESVNEKDVRGER